MSYDKYTPRRASQRWLKDAPPFVLDVLDNKGKTADRYTVLFTFPLAYAYQRDGVTPVPNGGRGAYARTVIPYLGMSAYPTHPQGVSQWGDMEAHDAASYRYRCKHHRIAWADLPDDIKAHVIARATEGDE